MKDFITSEMRMSAVKSSLLKRCKEYFFDHPPEYYEELKQKRMQEHARINNLGLRNDLC